MRILQILLCCTFLSCQLEAQKTTATFEIIEVDNRVELDRLSSADITIDRTVQIDMVWIDADSLDLVAPIQQRKQKVEQIVEKPKPIIQPTKVEPTKTEPQFVKVEQIVEKPKPTIQPTKVEPTKLENVSLDTNNFPQTVDSKLLGIVEAAAKNVAQKTNIPFQIFVVLGFIESNGFRNPIVFEKNNLFRAKTASDYTEYESLEKCFMSFANYLARTNQQKTMTEKCKGDTQCWFENFKQGTYKEKISKTKTLLNY